MVPSNIRLTSYYANEPRSALRHFPVTSDRSCVSLIGYERLTCTRTFAEWKVRKPRIMATHINSPEVSGLSCSSQESYEDDSDVKQHKSRTSKRRSRLKQLASARRQRWTDEADENDTDATTSGTTTPSASDSQTSTGQSDVSERGGCSAEKKMKLLRLDDEGNIPIFPCAEKPFSKIPSAYSCDERLSTFPLIKSHGMLGLVCKHSHVGHTGDRAIIVRYQNVGPMYYWEWPL